MLGGENFPGPSRPYYIDPNELRKVLQDPKYRQVFEDIVDELITKRQCKADANDSSSITETKCNMESKTTVITLKCGCKIVTRISKDGSFTVEEIMCCSPCKDRANID